MLLMTNRFKPDRRVNQAHLHDDGHDDAEPDEVELRGLQRRQNDRRGHQDDRDRRQEEASTTTISRIAASSTQRDRCMRTIHSAVDWLMCR